MQQFNVTFHRVPPHYQKVITTPSIKEPNGVGVSGNVMVRANGIRVGYIGPAASLQTRGTKLVPFWAFHKDHSQYLVLTELEGRPGVPRLLEGDNDAERRLSVIKIVQEVLQENRKFALRMYGNGNGVFKPGTNFKNLRLRKGSTVRVRSTYQSGYQFLKIDKVTDQHWITKNGLVFSKETGKTFGSTITYSIVDQHLERESRARIPL